MATLSSVHLRLTNWSTCNDATQRDAFKAATMCDSHLLHRCMLAMQIQGKNADHAQRVHIAISLDGCANRVGLRKRPSVAC
jgi:hypothetical protein